MGISLLGHRDQYILADSAQSLELDGGNTDTETENMHWMRTVEVCSTLLGMNFCVEMSDSGVRGSGITSFVRRLSKHK